MLNETRGVKRGLRGSSRVRRHSSSRYRSDRLIELIVSELVDNIGHTSHPLPHRAEEENKGSTEKWMKTCRRCASGVVKSCPDMKRVPD